MKKERGKNRQFLERVVALSAKERLECCLPSNALRDDQPDTYSVRLVDDRAMLVDPDSRDLVFDNTPIGWIMNGVWSIWPNLLPLADSSPSKRLIRPDQVPLRTLSCHGFAPCPALTLRPCEAEVYSRRITAPIVPALYVGDKFENDELASWRVQLFLRDVDDGYRIAGKKVQEAWLHQIPNASDPDPVYRFLKAPSARLREEAQRFLRHAFETVWQRGQFPLDRLPVIRERAMPAMNAKERKRLLGIKQKIDLENRYIGESVAILNMFERIELFNMAIRQEEEEAAKEAAKETKKEETKQEVPKAHPPVLILGPKGAGKSVLAELIHNHSLRRGRFLRVQKSSVVGNSKEFVLEKFVGYGPNSTVESADKKGTEGFVQEVKGGTIFFDEVHGIESWFQTYLHDILDGEEIDRPHGDQIPVQPDVRIILASNRSLKELETELNDDFLDRIREYCIVVRALKDRKEDIPLFAKEWCEGYKRDEAFLLALLKYDWPGNVRELKSVVKKAKALAKMKKSGELSLECIELRDSKSLDDLRERDDGEVEQELYSTLHSILLAQGYEKGRGLQKRMAGILGLAEATITRKLKKYLPHRAPT